MTLQVSITHINCFDNSVTAVVFVRLTFISIQRHQCTLVHVIRTSSKRAFDTEVHENTSLKASFMDAIFILTCNGIVSQREREISHKVE